MKYKVNLNGKIYEVEVEHGEAMLVAEYEAVAPAAVIPAAAPAATPDAAPAAAAAPSTAAGEQVLAPMPGNILRIEVTVGQKVHTGDHLVVLEAMKMENEIIAPKDGVVAQIVVSKGSVVNTGDVLVVLA